MDFEANFTVSVKSSISFSRSEIAVMKLQKIFWSTSGMFLEKTGKIKFIGKFQFFCHFIHPVFTGRKQCISAPQNTTGQKTFRRYPVLTDEIPAECITVYFTKICQFGNRCHGSTRFGKQSQTRTVNFVQIQFHKFQMVKQGSDTIVCDPQ